MTSPLNGLLVISLVTTTTVLGCGVMPPGQGSTRSFNVSGFSLPVAMAFSTAPNAPTLAPGISSSADAAKGFVARLAIQAVTDVLDQQGRAALLPDPVILSILNQLTIRVIYDPLECKVVFAPKTPVEDIKMAAIMPQTCVVIGSTVRFMCKDDMTKDCKTSDAESLTSIPSKHFLITGSLMTTNIIMANWSRQMWQSVVTRAVRMLASDPFGSHSLAADVTVF
ncbi:hypothetical protein KIN20_000681 [Parelaphostrongylus tenuis]|uniref:Secreted protein n=1 Tax=Parelaphostrongylus tenuis TaxID=148309 RepID=A0AAD5QG86_PARTN|nr:hypothetical protein KIN20_000681 [Parelaphostrongylus tenuis]